MQKLKLPFFKFPYFIRIFKTLFPEEILKDYSVQIVSVPILNKLTPEKTKQLNNNKLTFTLELGKSVGWSDYIGNITESFSISTFGKSAPEKDLAEFFKVNGDFIGKKIRNYLD